MSNALELEQEVLCYIILQPALLDAADGLSPEVFGSPKNRKTLAAISDIWEDNRPERINEVILADRVKLPLSEITQITVGAYSMTPENFRLLVRELRGKSLSGRLYRLTHAEVERHSKTGIWEWDPTKAGEVRRLFEELEGLKQCEAGGSSNQCLVRFTDMADWLFYEDAEQMNFSYDYGMARRQVLPPGWADGDAR